MDLCSHAFLSLPLPCLILVDGGKRLKGKKRRKERNVDLRLNDTCSRNRVEILVSAGVPRFREHPQSPFYCGFTDFRILVPYRLDNGREFRFPTNNTNIGKEGR